MLSERVVAIRFNPPGGYRMCRQCVSVCESAQRDKQHEAVCPECGATVAIADGHAWEVTKPGPH